MAPAARSSFAGAAGAAASCLRQDDFAAIECGFKSRIRPDPTGRKQRWRLDEV